MDLKTITNTNFQTIKNTDLTKEEVSLQVIKIGKGYNYSFPKGFVIDDLLSDAKSIMKQDDADEGLFYKGIYATIQTPLKNTPFYYFEKARKVFDDASKNEIIRTCKVSYDKKNILFLADLRDDCCLSEFGNSLRAYFSIDKNYLDLDFGRVNNSKAAFTLKQLEQFYKVVKTAYKGIFE